MGSTAEPAEDGTGQLVFIELPAVLIRDIGNFRPDPAIPVPVETGGDPERFDPRSITWEAIVAGMLRLLAWAPGHEHADYYRSFIVAVKPGILVELSEAGIVKAKNKDWPVAEEIFRALGGLFPEAPEPILNLAVLYEDRAESLRAAGREDAADAFDSRAHDAYSRLLAMEPPFPEAFFNAAFFHLRIRGYERARSLFETYAKIGDDDEKRSRAKEIAKKLSRQGYLDELFKEAYDFIRLGKEEEGLAKAQAFLEKNPTIWNAWFLVGWASRRLGQWDKGLEAFEKALELGAEGADVYNELSICLLELGRVGEARARLERALRLEPENVKIITNLGAVALRQGKNAEASGFFRAALEIEPEDRDAATWLASIEGSEG